MNINDIVNAIHNTIEDYAIDTDNGEEREDRPCGRHLELSSLLLTFPSMIEPVLYSYYNSRS